MGNQKRYKFTIWKRKKYGQILRRHKPILAEQDFYLPSDDRVWTSNVEDINGGDNFADYCKDFFDLLDEEEYFDNE